MPSTRYQKINAHHYRHIWVVGDIHGEYQLLQSRLHQLSFYPETAYLFPQAIILIVGRRVLTCCAC